MFNLRRAISPASRNERIREFVSKPAFNEKTLLSRDTAFPRVTVVTPSFNQAAFLERTILSVLNQNYPNLEYIIIDGGSKDGSAEIIKKYRKYLTYWVSEPDSGQSDAINKGFRRSTGTVCAYLNSDDCYLPGAIHAGVDALNKSAADIVYGHAYIVDGNDRPYRLAIALPFVLKEHAFRLFSVPQPSSFWKRQVYETVGGFNVEAKSCMDHEFYAMAGKIDCRFYRIDSVLSCFRMHPGSITMSGRLKDRTQFEVERVIRALGYGASLPQFSRLNRWYRLKHLAVKIFYQFRFRLNLFS